MAAKINRFKVVGLHERFTFDIPIEDNKIVLVGVNGLGKTTIVSMLFYFLTKQWSRLSKFSFQSLELDIDGELLSVTRSDLIAPHGLRVQLFKLAKIGDTHGLLNLLLELQLSDLLADDDRAHVERMIKELRHLSAISEVISPSRLQYMIQRSPVFRSARRLSKRVVEASEKLEAAKLRVLYLPTYRRIEQDLEEIFPGFSDEMRDHVRESIQGRKENESGFVELVEFGMGDVEASIRKITNRIRNTSRIEFSNLAGSYLRDVIRGEARKWDRKRVVNISEEQASAIVSRVEENTLSVDDRTKIIEAIRRARTQADLSDDDQLLAHFFWKLTHIFDRQKELETPIREFVNYCNRYLSGKRLSFDEAEIEVVCTTREGGRIYFKDLSSGEKQIVSVFAQLLLHTEEQWVVIIDEPELSLSVAWQKQFLPDLTATGKCAFVAAVTHSPFIFDNEFKAVTRDLSTLSRELVQ